MINRLKSIQLEPVEFIWKLVAVFLFGVPVPILGLGLSAWYWSVRNGFDRPMIALITTIFVVIGTVFSFFLVAWILNIGKKEKVNE